MRFAILVLVLLALGCDATPRVGGSCSTPREYSTSTGLVCCGGRWGVCSDCLGGPPHDAGPPDGGFPDASLACVEEGRSGCAHYFVAVCRDGTWQVEPPTRLCFAPGC